MREGRCVLFFARSPREEARQKGLPGAEPLFDLAAGRVACAAAQLGLDLLVVSDGAASGIGGLRLEQRGCGFAERLGNAFSDAWALGYRQVLAVPGDVPGIAAADFAECLAALDQGRVVVGPSPDGGVYLLGVAGVRPDLLQGVRWQTPAVQGDLLLRAGALAHVLAPLSDLDDRRSLPGLALENAHDPVVLDLIRAVGRPLTVRGPVVGERPARQTFFGAFSLRGPPPLA